MQKKEDVQREKREVKKRDIAARDEKKDRSARESYLKEEAEGWESALFRALKSSACAIRNAACTCVHREVPAHARKIAVWQVEVLIELRF